MAKLFNILYHGELSPKYQVRVFQEIQEANRKSVISYASISMIAFIAMALYATLGENAVSMNKQLYIIGALLMAFMLVSNLFLTIRYRKLIHLTCYLFVAALMGIGILLAINSKADVTASYMVFLFVAPLLFTLRPLNVILIIIGSDLVYLFCMYKVQTTELFHINLINAVIYGFLSIFVSTVMLQNRIQKFETDYMNRILMETDQLTGMLNRRSFEQHIERLKESGTVTGMKVCAFDVNGLKQVNDNIGHHAGDELLRGAASCLENVFANYGYCYRIGGDEFIAILQGSSPSESELIEMLNHQTLSFKGTYVPSLSISAGIMTGSEEDNIMDLLLKADAKMYENKAEYYKRNGITKRTV